MSQDDAAPTAEPMNRRRLLRTAAIGAGVALASAALPGRASAAATFTGDITLGAHLVTFVGAPISLQGSTSWSVTRQRTDTLTMTATANRALSLSFETMFSGTTFGTTFKQTSSSSITGAVTIRNTETITLTSQAQAGSDGYARPGNTTFYLYARPKLNLTGDPGSGFKYKFLNQGFVMIASLDQLLSDPNTRGPIGALTADNIAALYPFREGNTTSAALTSGRFKQKKQISAGPSGNPYQFINSIESGSTVSVGRTETFAAEIKESFGFSNPADPNGSAQLQVTFGVGQSIEVSVNAVQERTLVTILSTGGTLWNDRPRRLNILYKVKAWKTFIMSDEGPVTGSQLVAQGQVTDPYGTPVGGVVGLVNGTTTLESTSDPATGNFSIYSTTALASGTYTVVCGDATSYVSPGGYTYLRPSPGTEDQPIYPIETA